MPERTLVSDAKIILPYLGYEDIATEFTKTMVVTIDFTKTNQIDIVFEKIKFEDGN